MSASIRGKQPVGIPAPAVKDVEIPNLPRGCKATVIGLSFDGDPTEEQLVKVVEVIERRGKGHQWQLGDALVELKQRYPERSLAMLSDEADKAREKNGYASRKQAWQVAYRYPQGNRLPELSHTHHLAAAFFDTLDERLHWLYQARDNGWSVSELQKAIREAGKTPEEPPDPDLFVLKDPAVRAFLEKDRDQLQAELSEVPESAGFLRDLIHGRIDATDWQLKRTLESDQDEVRDGVSEVMGTAYQVFLWLKSRARIISPPDVRVYLGMLKDAGRITEEKDEQPNSLARGTTVTVYKPKRNAYDNKRDEERRSKVVV